MNKLLALALLSIALCSCSTKTELVKTTKIIVTADSCKRWGLDPVNFEVEYPESYSAELNPTGGFYLQLRKVNGDTILQEISFGRGRGLTAKNLKSNLESADSVAKAVFIEAGQSYSTDFAGTEEFLGQTVFLVRATVSMHNVPREGFIANGNYSTLMTCLFSKIAPEQAIVLSTVSTLKEPVDSKTKFGLENKEILNSIRVN